MGKRQQLRMPRSRLILPIILCAIALFSIGAAGTAAAESDRSPGGIESPILDGKSDLGTGLDAGNSSNITSSVASSGNITAEDIGDVPPETILGSVGSEDGNVAINDIVLTENGNYLLIITVVNSTTVDGAVAKISSEGSAIWSERFRKEGQQSLLSGIRTQSGNYVLSGWTETDESYTGWGVKIDQDGSKLWEAKPSGFSKETFYGVEETNDGEYLFAGDYVSSEGDNNAVVVKTTSDGENIWDLHYWDQQEQNSQNFFDIERIDSNQYVAVGQVYNDGNWDGWAFVIDADGEILGSGTQGHSILDDWINEVSVADNGDLVYAGVQNGNYDSENKEYTSLDGWIFYDTQNDQNQWSKTVSVNSVNRFSAVDTTDNRIVAVGHTSSKDGVERDRITVEYDLDGSRNWLDTTDNAVEQDADGVLVKSSETYVVGEKKKASGSNYSGILWKYDSTGVVKLTNVSIDSGTVTDGSKSKHTLTFDALHVSADNDPDKFTITIPDSVTLKEVNNVSVEGVQKEIEKQKDGNKIIFEVNPESSAESVDLSVTAKIELSTQKAG